MADVMFIFISSGSQWTGEYVMEFQDLLASASVEPRNQTEEARYSFIQGGYVEDLNSQGSLSFSLPLALFQCTLFTLENSFESKCKHLQVFIYFVLN